MTKYNILIRDVESEQATAIDTDGFVVIHLEQGKLKVTGKIEISELAPILLKIGLEKIINKYES